MRIAGAPASPGTAPRSARRGVALTELLLALPVLCLLILAVSRLGQAQGILAPAHHAARYAAWSEAAVAAAPPASPVPAVLDGDAERAAHAPPGARVALESLPIPEGRSAARRLVSAHAEVIVPDLAQAGRVQVTARVREDERNGAGLFPAAEASARAVAPVGPARPRRPGWMPTLGEGPSRFWSRAFAGP